MISTGNVQLSSGSAGVWATSQNVNSFHPTMTDCGSRSGEMGLSLGVVRR